MLAFWNRKGNKALGTDTTNPLPQPPEQDADVQPSIPMSQRLQTIQRQEEPPLPEPVPDPVIAAIDTPHDSAIAQVHAKLLQVENLSSIGRSSRTSVDDPLADGAITPKSAAEPLFDPATGVQRGYLESVSMGGSGDGEQQPDEAWTHLARIRELQREIAVMHMNMEGIGEGSGSMNVEVDVDVDVDTVPTQEEEEAAKREKEFAKLPSIFKGRSGEIDAMMTKLNDLSSAVTAFHAIQLPPLNFDTAPTTRESTRSEMPPPLGESTISAISRTRPSMPSAAMFGSKAGPDQNQVTDVLHDSPISGHTTPPPPDVSTK